MSEAQAIGPAPAPVDVIVGSSTIQQVVLVEVHVAQGLPGSPAAPSTPAEVIAALGYTPANKAGDTFGGNVTAPNIIGSAQVYSPGYAQFAGGVYPGAGPDFVLTGIAGAAGYADFNLNAAALTRLRFVYASKILVLYIDNVAVFSINAAGNVVAKGSITPNATPADFAAFGVELELPPDTREPPAPPALEAG